MLHSRLLRYIDEIARCGSIRAAGERLHVAPSAINKHLLLLEEELGGPLFERLPRGMRPTPTGELLLGHLRKTMLEYRQVEAEIRDLKTLQRGEVIIATMAGLASGIISTAALNFCARHPQMKVSIRIMFKKDMVEAVASGDADLGKINFRFGGKLCAGEHNRFECFKRVCGGRNFIDPNAVVQTGQAAFGAVDGIDDCGDFGAVGQCTVIGSLDEISRCVEQGFRVGLGGFGQTIARDQRVFSEFGALCVEVRQNSGGDIGVFDCRCTGFGCGRR